MNKFNVINNKKKAVCVQGAQANEAKIKGAAVVFRGASNPISA